ncbi:unnamed protein product [Gemmata massiliana]|uniref:Uncharacterized protein n=1 Tax=Gemmata massiliana TaxID=1210884 RepID=A0A6P2D4I4_9BACT|nr:hypothetical protein [Gemmata massiliana]VTR96039.1 unnamed protein product [Gemmata massiliana]
MADTSTAKKPAPKGIPTTDTLGATFPGSANALVIPDPEVSPRDRVTEAVRGKPARSLVEVFAADVVALAALVPEPAHTPVIGALRDGAASAVRDSQTPSAQTVYQVAGQLAHLLGSAS